MRRGAGSRLGWSCRIWGEIRGYESLEPKGEGEMRERGLAAGVQACGRQTRSSQANVARARRGTGGAERMRERGDEDGCFVGLDPKTDEYLSFTLYIAHVSVL